MFTCPLNLVVTVVQGQRWNRTYIFLLPKNGSFGHLLRKQLVYSPILPFLTAPAPAFWKYTGYLAPTIDADAVHEYHSSEQSGGETPVELPPGSRESVLTWQGSGRGAMLPLCSLRLPLPL